MRRAFNVLLLVWMIIGMMTACEDDKGHEEIVSSIEAMAEVTEGDFAYRLVSVKPVYAEGEKIEVYAELEYIGERPEIRIAHNASPFFFPMKENKRGYSFLFMMNQPRRYTVLTKGEPFREPLQVQAGYNSEDPEDYIAFVKSAAEAYKSGTLPWGDYEVLGSAQFSPIYDEDQELFSSPLENETLRLEAMIEFRVE